MGKFTHETASECGKAGGEASGRARRERASLRKALMLALSAEYEGRTVSQAIALSLVKKAITGDIAAIRMVRDILQEPPEVAPEHNEPIIIRWETEEDRKNRENAASGPL